MIFLLVNLAGALLIALIIWWFWLSTIQSSFINAGNFIEIKVKDGVYQPAQIQIEANRPVTLRFIREDHSPCAETVIFNSLNISKTLPLNQPADIPLTIKKSGEYEFTCQMGMYRGMLIVTS